MQLILKKIANQFEPKFKWSLQDNGRTVCSYNPHDQKMDMVVKWIIKASSLIFLAILEF